MNIWALSKYSSVPGYGSAARLFHLVSHFRQMGHETTLITSDANHLSNFPQTSNVFNYDKIKGVFVCWIKTKKYLRTASFSRVLSWVDFEIKLFLMPINREKKPDVLIVSSLSLLSIIYGYCLKLRFGCKLVFEVRDIWPLTMTEEGGFSRWHPLVLILGAIEKFGYRKADLIVGTMPKLDEHIYERIGEGKPFFCSPLGFENVKLESIGKDRKNILEAYFPKGKIIVGYCGSMGISNALEPFVECIEKIGENSTVHFVLVGDGDLRKKFVKRLGRSDNTTFVNKISSDEVPHFLSMCDVLYLSTHDSKVWRFGQSMNKFVEYMLAGKPIIASYSGFPSMLDESEAGEFVLPNDGNALKAAVSKYCSMSSAERETIGGNGRRWILRNRSYCRLAEDYLVEIEKLLAKAP